MPANAVKNTELHVWFEIIVPKSSDIILIA